MSTISAAKKWLKEKKQALMMELPLTKQACETVPPKGRSLERSLANLKAVVNLLKDAQVKYLAVEENEDDRKTVIEEMLTIMGDVDDVMDEAEDILDNLNNPPADDPQKLTSEQLTEIEKVKVQNVMDRYKARIKRLADSVAEITVPHKGQIDKQHDILNELRRESVRELKNAYVQLEAFAENATKRLQIIKEHEAHRVELESSLDALEAQMMRISPDTSVNANPLASSSVNVSSASNNVQYGYKDYNKEDYPVFSGEMRDYPSWKKEMSGLVLPGMIPERQLRLLNKLTPKNVDLQHCAKPDDAWTILDTKFGNAVKVSTIVVKDFFNLKLKSRSNYSKMIELNEAVQRLNSDLLAVKYESDLHNNTYLLHHIHEMMPDYWLNKFSEKQAELTRLHGSQWGALSSFLVDESIRIERDLPYKLDNSGDSAPSEKSKPNASSSIDMSKLPPRLRKQVNAALAKGDGQKEDDKSNNTKQRKNAPKSSKYNEMAEKMGRAHV